MYTIPLAEYDIDITVDMELLWTGKWLLQFFSVTLCLIVSSYMQYIDITSCNPCLLLAIQSISLISHGPPHRIELSARRFRRSRRFHHRGQHCHEMDPNSSRA
jgi:hypothetical protein